MDKAHMLSNFEFNECLKSLMSIKDGFPKEFFDELVCINLDKFSEPRCHFNHKTFLHRFKTYTFSRCTDSHIEIKTDVEGLNCFCLMKIEDFIRHFGIDELPDK